MHWWLLTIWPTPTLEWHWDDTDTGTTLTLRWSDSSSVLEIFELHDSPMIHYISQICSSNGILNRPTMQLTRHVAAPGNARCPKGESWCRSGPCGGATLTAQRLKVSVTWRVWLCPLSQGALPQTHNLCGSQLYLVLGGVGEDGISRA